MSLLPRHLGTAREVLAQATGAVGSLPAPNTGEDASTPSPSNASMVDRVLAGSRLAGETVDAALAEFSGRSARPGELRLDPDCRGACRVTLPAGKRRSGATPGTHGIPGEKHRKIEPRTGITAAFALSMILRKVPQLSMYRGI